MSDNITLPREVADYLMEVLEESPHHGDWSARDNVALAALRTALAAEQPKPEPVAWQCREHGDGEWFDCSKEAYGINPSRYVYRRLYTAPPDAEALRRDAERYRYLRDKAYVWDSDMPKAMRPVALWLHADGNDNIDAAIDAAMEGKR